MDTFKNFAIAQVATPPTPPTTGTSLTLTPGAGAYMPPVPFTVAAFNGAAYATATNAELVRVTAIVGDTLSGLIRGYEGSTPRAIASGDYIAQTFTAQFVADVTNSGNQTAGTLPDARLSANVPLKNTSNTFTQNQALVGGGLFWTLTDPAAPVDARTFLIRNTNQWLAFQAVNDAITTQQAIVTMDHSGVLVAGAGLGATPLNASQLASGSVPDARLSANVPRLNASNVFIGPVQEMGVVVRVRNPTPPADQRLWQLYAGNTGPFTVSSVNDAATVETVALILSRTGNLTLVGDLTEKNRLTPMGHWTNVPFSPSNFGATGGTWTIGSAAVLTNRYALIGKTLLWSLYISWFSGSNVLAGSVTAVTLTLPAALVSAVAGASVVAYVIDNGVQIGNVTATFSGTVVTVAKVSGAAFNPGTALGLITTFTFEIQ